tara:strand:- start:256 stop:495 length:240 start_codon:yes stop_codon:yes gene_type:complete
VQHRSSAIKNNAQNREKTAVSQQYTNNPPSSTIVHSANVVVPQDRGLRGFCEIPTVVGTKISSEQPSTFAHDIDQMQRI